MPRALLALLLLAACREDAPRAAPEVLAPEPAPPSEVKAPPSEEASVAPPLTTTPAPDASEPPSAPEPREPSVVTELPELCRLACENALHLVLGELPEDTAKAMRDEVRQAMVRDCPGRCLQRASLESARCGANAKSALELAACP